MDKFFAQLKNSPQNDSSKTPPVESDSAVAPNDADSGPKRFPKGVVLGKDGKPCRSCTSFASWAAMTKKSTLPPSTNPTSLPLTQPPDTLPPDCPPDVSLLGNHAWTLLHSISASYPPSASPTQQSEMRQFLSLFAKLYPCWVCADDFKAWMEKKGNEPQVEGRVGLGRWMCEAHNEVNRKLGKGEFDCGKWEERWRVGWADGRCG